MPYPRNQLDLSGSRILIVDDTIANIDVLFQILNDENYNVAVAMDGEVALQAVRARMPRPALR